MSSPEQKMAISLLNDEQIEQLGGGVKHLPVLDDLIGVSSSQLKKAGCESL